MRITRALALPLVFAISACGSPETADTDQYGPHPVLPAPNETLLPPMRIAMPTAWNGDVPRVPPGFRITAIATGLRIPRQILVLPNGDLLVAEGQGRGEPQLRPKDLVEGAIKKMAHSHIAGGNRITLLRDRNGDGVPDVRSIFLANLHAPYGMALVGNDLYVANTDSLVRYPYRTGETRIVDKGTTVTALPAGEINHHWTKSLTASRDGTKLYVGIGSNSNASERGMSAEQDRARIWEIDCATGMHRDYATGLRNPAALATDPASGQLWAAVNERDELGPKLVPDYVTAVRQGAFYGWPYSYWGQHPDPRVMPRRPELVAIARSPDYGLGSHVAPLGLAFSVGGALGPEYRDGIFVGEHGSWNRTLFAGYKVVWLSFRNGQPVGTPRDVVTGFLDQKGRARGRPVGVAVDPRGALLIADDLSNTVWRMSRIPAPHPPISRAPRTSSGAARH